MRSRKVLCVDAFYLEYKFIEVMNTEHSKNGKFGKKQQLTT